MTKVRPAPDYDLLTLSQSEQASIIKKKLSEGEFAKLARVIIADALGPMTVSERWNAAPELGFNQDLRRRIDFQGSAQDVAFSAIDVAKNYGYPPSVEIADLVIRSSDERNIKLADTNLDAQIRSGLKVIYGD
jgi:hypothetical protein